MDKRQIDLIMDLQYGSTGKGLLAGYLAEKQAPDTVMTAWAANAGHTYINAQGIKFVHTMLANGVVSSNLRQVMIGPGSVLDLDNLLTEIESSGICARLQSNQCTIYIHENAAVITQMHRDEEAGPMTKIGSTKKGCGAAAIQRIRRDPDRQNTARSMAGYHPVKRWVTIVNSAEWRDILFGQSQVIQIEGAQGHSLSMYHGFYPYCTSRDVSALQIAADVGLPAGWMPDVNVIGTCRTFPIRVANRFDDDGKQIGWSGPHYPDQIETNFAELGQQTELTTVTRLPRRIFTFSEKQIKDAILQNGVKEVFLNFCNYARSEEELDEIVAKIEKYAHVRYMGDGPTVLNVFDVSDVRSHLVNLIDNAKS